MNTMTQTCIRHELIDQWIDDERAANRLGAGVLSINIGGHARYLRSFGYLDRGGSRPVTEDSRFWIASMTKPVTSLAVMMLVERGVIDLGAPVSRYIKGFGRRGVLDRFGETVPLKREPTILDLMTHMAGLTYGNFGNEHIHRLYQAAGVVDYSFDNAEIARRLADLPLLHQPGTVFEYGMSTDLLGRIVEIASGESLAAALETLIFQPLEMNNTSFHPRPRDVALLPPSDIQRALAPPLNSAVRWQSGGAGLFSTAADYVKFARLLLSGGKRHRLPLLGKKLTAAMLHHQLPAGISFGAYTAALGPAAPWPENGLGFGLGLAVRTSLHPDIPGNIGEFFWPGASGANFWADPATQMVVVSLNHESDERVRHRIGLRKAVYSALS